MAFKDSNTIKKKITEVIKLFRVSCFDISLIQKYRRYIYAKELDEQDIESIFNLDQEFGQFKTQKHQIISFLKKISAFYPNARVYLDELDFAKSQHDLNDFSALISFMKSYFQDELSTIPEEHKRKAPARVDKVHQAREKKLDEFARRCILRPESFIENLQHMKLVNKPPEPQDLLPFQVTQQYMDEHYNDQMKVLSGVCEFAATELACQPYIRQKFKQFFYKNGFITTTPTEKGMKDIDAFHPSYRVKRITKEPIANFHSYYREETKNKNYDDEIFLDIMQNEKLGMINVEIALDQEPKAVDVFQNELERYFLDDQASKQWNIIRKTTLDKLVNNKLLPDITKEVRTELQQISENCVIQKCQDKYRSLIMTGPFDCLENDRRQSEYGKVQAKKKPDDEIIKDRPRYTVMGATLQQIDSQNHMVTVAIVDKYGELIAHKDFMHLIPPRKPPVKAGLKDEDEHRYKKLNNQEEIKEHEKDKDKIKEMISKFQVDLIVVGANKLEARRVKETLKDIAENIKSFGDESDDENRRSKKRSEYEETESKREAFVIWGNMEVPKLFSSNHQGEKLLKNCNLIVKQTVSLARYQQDPMCEILNLWSSIPSENSALSIGLHPLQKLVNQAKLADSLEQVTVQCVNDVGVDLNLIIEHDHMHCLLQFVSGLGPRKAKKLIQKFKQLGRKVSSRSEFLNFITMGKNVFISVIPFLKIKVTSNELERGKSLDLLDQTRIHLESYTMAIKVACDAISQNINDQQSDFQKFNAIKDIILNPRKLECLDKKQYEDELKMTGQGHMTSLLDLIFEELEHPFKDPRKYRTPSDTQMTNSELLYLLIDESERTFKYGIIVTATIVKIDKNVLCKLDNGLDALISKEEICSSNERLEDVLQQGQVITGRIDKINFETEKQFSVTLKCKRADLERHDKFIGKRFVHKDDLINLNFKIEDREKHQSKYTTRRINHPKFKNISSSKALEELKTKELGDFIFRPSSKGPDNITLTWKFYHNNYVHIDIQESEKSTGASIGSKLRISDEIFENLQEIVDRYIVPSNRALREIINHPKFLICENEDQFGEALKKEKAEDSNRIPYRFCILEQYPQHVILGYIAKADKIEKEYIKIKPRGYYFHERYHNPFQHLINWFKDNFKSKDYQKLKIRTDKRPPVAKLANPADLMRKSTEGKGSTTAMDWEPAPQRFGNSDNDYAREVSGSGRYGGTNTQYSDYNSTRQMNDQGSRSKGTCYNCGQEGHMSRDCTEPKKQQSFGRGGGRDRPPERQDQPAYDNPSTSWRGEQEQSKFQEAEPQWNQEQQWGQSSNAQNKSSAQNWRDAPMKTESKSPTKSRQEKEGGQAQDQSHVGGWGQKTPNRNDMQASSWDQDGNNNWNSEAWNAGGGDDNSRGSPARSQRSFDGGRGGRGRGRGRADGQGRGGGGGTRECFKCHQEGHMARECPNSNNDDRPRGRGGPGGGGGRGCFKCGEDGHMARECPNQDSSFGDRGRGRGRGRGRDSGGHEGGRSCFKCNQEGHFARECPNASESGERPYKRQRRDDNGGSYRRHNDQEGNDNWNSNNDDGGSRWESRGGQDNSNNWGLPGDFPSASNTSNDQPSNSWRGAETMRTKDENASGWQTQNKQNESGGW